MRTRPLVAALAALLVAGTLAGCDAAPDTNTAVLTVNESRDRYLDAMCPLRADDGFWRRSGSASAAAAELAVADPAIAAVADPPRPYPRLLRPSMTRLIAVLKANRRYFAAVRDAPDAAAAAALAPPAPVPDGIIGEVEAVVTVSSAAGSGNCTGHLPSPSPSTSPSSGG